MSKNERNTENLVRNVLRNLGYWDAGNDIRVEEQKSSTDGVKRLLKAASKSGRGGHGAPEFIVSEPGDPDLLVICECKADPRDHASEAVETLLAGQVMEETAACEVKRVQRYAADGVLHYAKFLAREYSVVAVAVSGQTESAMHVSTYLYPKGAASPSLLTAPGGAAVDRIIPWRDYVSHATFDPAVRRTRVEDLMALSRELHNFMRDHAKLTESEKPLVVSGTLIALCNKAFAVSYDEHRPEDLQKEWMRVIREEIHRAEIPQAKKDTMVQPFSSIAVHPELGKATIAFPKGPLHELIRRLKEKVWPFISVYREFDVVGQFYGEFLKYTGGDKKALGIVLTPRHITELFALLANVTKDSRVLDTCAGTGGFLISAMDQMMRDTQTEAERQAIRSHGLVGVEQQPNMFALAASNMILRGDGKANLYQGSCLDSAIIKAVRGHKCNVGMLNPPFSQGDESQHELYFIKQLLDCLVPGGVGLAIAPMSCAIAPHRARGELLKSHTLEAVMSLPDELFYPVGTITCAMVFTAHVPHATSDKKTWFGYWKRDGFVKTKHRGRIDLYNEWTGIRDRWVEMFRNREVHAGASVMCKVGADDEWCAEAYMETDYGQLTRAEFEKTVRNYAIFRLLGAQEAEVGSGDEHA